MDDENTAVTDDSINGETQDGTQGTQDETQGVVVGETDNGVTREVLQEAAGQALVSILKGGQSYKVGSRQLTKADFAAVRSFKNDLDAAEAAENNTSGLFDNCYVADFTGR